MGSRLTPESRREVRLITGACALLSGAALASSVSPAIESVVGTGTVALLCLTGLWVVYRVARSVWLSLLIEQEARAANRANHRAAEALRRDEGGRRA